MGHSVPPPLLRLQAKDKMQTTVKRLKRVQKQGEEIKIMKLPAAQLTVNAKSQTLLQQAVAVRFRVTVPTRPCTHPSDMLPSARSTSLLCSVDVLRVCIDDMCGVYPSLNHVEKESRNFETHRVLRLLIEIDLTSAKISS